MENIEFYKFNGGYYMHNMNNGVEGKVILGSGNHGGEIYAYVSHVEFDFELDMFKERYNKVDEDFTDYYNAVEPYLDTRNDEVGKINAAIWAYFEYRNLRDEREYKNNNK